eukprot:scaffold143144_cov17-Prasinocladus_malaysianus.AAC.1
MIDDVVTQKTTYRSSKYLYDHCSASLDARQFLLPIASDYLVMGAAVMIFAPLVALPTLPPFGGIG